jgi:hypothetical protein
MTFLLKELDQKEIVVILVDIRRATPYGRDSLIVLMQLAYLFQEVHEK